MLNHVSSSGTQQQKPGPPPTGASLPGQNSAQHPTLADPVSGPVQMAWGLWNTYGPSIIARGTVLLAAAAPPAAAAAETRSASPRDESYRLSGTTASSTSVDTSRPVSLIERRRQLEAELAQLPPLPHPASFDSTSPAGSGFGSSPEMEGASVYLPAGGENEGAGRYERIDRDEVGSGSDGPSSPVTPSRSGWFGGWGAPKGGYEKLKGE